MFYKFKTEGVKCGVLVKQNWKMKIVPSKVLEFLINWNEKEPSYVLVLHLKKPKNHSSHLYFLHTKSCKHSISENDFTVFGHSSTDSSLVLESLFNELQSPTLNSCLIYPSSVSLECQVNLSEKRKKYNFVNFV